MKTFRLGPLSIVTVALVSAICLCAAPFIAAASPGSTILLSQSSLGLRGGTFSFDPTLSSDGRYAAFASSSANLVPGDVNGVEDIFVHDRVTGATTMVSVDPFGAPGNAMCWSPSISANGRFVAFVSRASNLVSGDTNGIEDVFVRDRLTGVTTRVDVTSAGGQVTGLVEDPSLSADGRYVVFRSDASDLVTGDTNASWDIFLRDRTTGVTTRVSVASSGAEGVSGSFEPAISGDGRYIAFRSNATNLVPGDTNATDDVFIHDRVAHSTSRVSLDSAGVQGNGASYSPSLSYDGRYVAFSSYAASLSTGDTNLVSDIFVCDRAAGMTTRISVGPAGALADGDSWYPSISADGRRVGYESNATNLVTGDTNGSEDIFVRDRVTAVTTRESVSSSGAQADHNSQMAALSADGNSVAFWSVASNLVGADVNGAWDAFERELSAALSRPSVGTPVAPARMSHSRSYTVYGYLKPRHTAGSYPVRIYRYRLVGRVWRSYGYVTARASNVRTYTRYTRSVRLPYAGKWRLRAFAPADARHTDAWSAGYDYVTVR